MTVGQRLKQFRLEQGMTQTDVAKILGVTKGAVQKYECGEIVNFKSDTIRKLSELFRVPPVYFIYDEVPDHSENVHAFLAEYFGEWYLEFMTDFTLLTAEGQTKVTEYCKDLSLIDKYRHKGDDSNDKQN